MYNDIFNTGRKQGLQMSNSNSPPFIKPSQQLAEITIKGTILSILLAMLLAAANTYLGLKIGITITGSIPAAIISMAILKLFKSSTILENNIVQTGASAGDTLAAGAIFTLPAAIIINYWLNFDFWECFIITATGGTLGVLFSIPLRRAFINDKTLKFPEGVAIGNVLIAGSDAGENVKSMVTGSVIAGIVSFAQNGLKIVSDSAWLLFRHNGAVFGMGTGFDMAILGAGYIVGINVGISILVGAVIAWLIAMPIFSTLYPTEHLPILSNAMQIWSNHIRYLGVGTMSVGGVWALFSLFKQVASGIKSSLATYKINKQQNIKESLRTETDIPFNYIIWGIAAITIISFIVVHKAVDSAGLDISYTTTIVTVCVGVALLIVLGFVLSSICCFLAGLVGSSSNPMSGLLITGILVISLCLLPVLGGYISFDDPSSVKKACGITIVIIAIIGSATAIAQDNMQDLKAGQIVGATPWKQQIMLILGVLSAALILPPTLELLYNAYGIGGSFPRAGMDPEQMLAAPQAALIASVATGVFGLNLPWYEIGAGAIIGILTIMLDKYIKKSGKRLPVLAVGIGIYLPATAAMTLVVGSLLSYFVHKGLDRQKSTTKEQKTDQAKQIGISIASGFVCGGSLMGIILAIPAVIYQTTDTFRILPSQWSEYSEIIAILCISGIFYWFYKTIIKHALKS